MPDFIPVSNPMDLTAQALVDPDLYRRTLEPLLADDRFVAVVMGIIQTDRATAARKFPPIIDAVRNLSLDKPVIFAGLDEGAEIPPEYIRDLRFLGIAYFPSADRAMRALARLINLSAMDRTVIDAAPVALTMQPGSIPEYEAKRILAPLGIAFPTGGMARSVDEACAAARAVGYPVAMKAQAAALGHKSDAGGVILKIADEDALRAAWGRLYENVARYDASIVLDGALIEAMGEPGVELIIGARNDPEWGGVILAGFGGVTAELIHDVRLLPVGLSRAAIIGELRQLKQAALFDGYRGAPPLDVEAVADIVVALGCLIRGTPQVREIDLNPVVVYAKGKGAVALDALILA
jgi:acyl-CoA synthetase (NDP forming)